MKRIIGLVLSLLTLWLITATVAFAVIKTSSTITNKSKATYLFVMHAAKANIAQNDGTYQLTLKDIDKKVLYFSNHPVRKAGYILNSKFMENWIKAKNSFQANPPNAAIIYSNMNADANGISKAIAVELMNPKAVDSNLWTFQLKDLEGKVQAGDFDDVSIFIDAGGLMQLVAYGAN